MLQRLRTVLVRPGREQLAGRVEVDETFYGGTEIGLRGGRARGKKVLVGIAVEADEAGTLGRCRVRLLPDASQASLNAFVTEHARVGACVVSDAWSGYAQLRSCGFEHEVRNQSSARREGVNVDALLPGVHRVASLVKRWLLCTHQGAVGHEHLQATLDEYVFRFNRRSSRSRGMVFYRVLQLAVGHAPVRYRSLIANSRPGSVFPTPPTARGRPASLERPHPGRPCRQANEPKADSMDTPDLRIT